MTLKYITYLLSMTERKITMKYFTNCRTLDELKKEFRRLCMIHHPDRGGDTATMAVINAEYEALFPQLRQVYNRTAETPSTETAASYRSEFYTANGWKGSNYQSGRSLKEIAQLVRKFIKEQFPTFKFSVRTAYASMCQELHVDMKEAPCKVYKDLDELTMSDIEDFIRKANRNNVWSLTCWTDAEAQAEIARIWETEGDWFRIPSDQITAAAEAVDSYVNSFNRSDCDSMIDYFDVNFYYFGCLQDNARSVQFVPKTARITGKAATKQEQPAPVGFLRVEFAPEFDGVEVYFPSKPSEATRTALKAAGYRWHSKKQCWYAKNTEQHLQALRAIETGLTA